MARAELDILTEQVDGVTVITLIGPVDSATYEEFKNALTPLCRGNAPQLAIDCRHLTYINSKGIGILANLHRQAMIQMGNVALFSVSRRIQKTLDLLGLGKRLRLFDTREEALQSFSQTPPDAAASGNGE